MQKMYFKKMLVIGIIVWFFGLVIIPRINCVNTIKNKSIETVTFNPFEEGWKYRKKITIDHSLVAGNLLNFPVLVSTTDSDLRDKAQVDGDDILFMDDKGEANQLFHEIEYYESSTGKLISWVNIPIFSTTADTVFYIYYGNLQCANQEFPELVWDSNFVAVWHMGGSSYTDFEDSTANNFDATNDVGGPTYQKLAKIGFGVEFDGVDDEIQICDDNKFTFADDSGDKPCSFEAWIKTASQGTIVTKFMVGETGEWLFYVIPTNKCNLFLRDSFGSARNARYTISDVTTNIWTYVTATYDGSSIYQGITNYINGIDDSGYGDTLPTYSHMRNGNEIVRIGQYGNEVYFDGIIDEIRISNVERSSAWIETSYNSMGNPSDFINFGPEQPKQKAYINIPFHHFLWQHKNLFPILQRLILI